MEKPHQYTAFRASDKEVVIKVGAPVCKGMPAEQDGGVTATARDLNP